jgi:hypothetical protein
MEEKQAQRAGEILTNYVFTQYNFESHCFASLDAGGGTRFQWGV